jgi:hypothetical protein
MEEKKKRGRPVTKKDDQSKSDNIENDHDTSDSSQDTSFEDNDATTSVEEPVVTSTSNKSIPSSVKFEEPPDNDTSSSSGKSDDMGDLDDPDLKDFIKTTVLQPPNTDFDEYVAPPIERAYTEGPVTATDSTPIDDIPEPEFIPTATPPTGSGNTNATGSGNGNGGGGTSDPKTGTTSSGGGGSDGPKTTDKKPEPIPVNPEYKDMSTTQKRKAAEKTADSLLLTYCKFVPMPFKKFSSFNEKKIERLAMDGSIDLDMELQNDMTVGEYFDNVNKEVQAIFTISPETQTEIREPLIEVLMENGMALTPTQRLFMAIGGNILEMGFKSVELFQSNRAVLDAFKKYQSDRKADQERERMEKEEEYLRNKIKKEEANRRKESEDNNASDDIEEESDRSPRKTSDHKEEENPKKPSMDDVLNNQTDGTGSDKDDDDDGIDVIPVEEVD